MKEPAKTGSGFWRSLRSGGVPSAIASVFGAPSAQQMAFIRSLSREQRRTEVLHLPLSRLETVVFDLETTGFHAQHGDEILSFGAVKMIGDEPVDEFYTLVNPKITVPDNITVLTGITQEMTDQAPALIDGLHDFMAFAGRSVLIAHGTGHDKAFLNAALWRTSKIQLTHRILDTMMIAKWLKPSLGSYGLDEVLEDANIPITMRHHALEDAKMTASLWKEYLRLMRHKQVETLEDLYAYLCNF
ncbi:exonuclease domain-containing protein [Paenibacillus sp. Z6-24]